MKIFLAVVGAAQSQEIFLSTKPQKPNFVWFLTDDQDQLLGGSFPPALSGTPMPKTKALMQDGGAYGSNWYIHTPICSPSRSELLAGRYFHNIKQVGGSGYCAGMHVNYTFVNNNTFAKILQEEAGYTVGMFGKYLNEMPDTVPPGFDTWFANNGGTYIAPSFQVANVDGFEDGTWHGTSDNYSTAVIGNVSVAWIKKVAKQDRPFLAYIGPKAAHGPFNPAPWYREAWDASWPEQEPRDENWNCSFDSRKDHPGNIPGEPLISAEAARVITGIWRNRWRTLMSVDDLISDVIQAVDDAGASDRTYFFYSSDHGFQLGQFNIPMDKRHVYEWDTKIHLLVRGPGVQSGAFAQPGTQVDIAPTLLGLAGLDAPAYMDGKSMVPFMVDAHSNALTSSTKAHLAKLGDLKQYKSNWRQEVFIEYYYCEHNIKCISSPNHKCPPGNYPLSDSNCADLTPGANADCWCSTHQYPTDPDDTCYATEDTSNNFIALRSLRPGDNSMYVEYQKGDLTSADIAFDKVDFVEYYDLDKDAVQMKNLAKTLQPDVKRDLSKRLHEWLACSGSSCP